jgi:uncharacterized protein YaaW (UPF0174 family)
MLIISVSTLSLVAKKHGAAPEWDVNYAMIGQKAEPMRRPGNLRSGGLLPVLRRASHDDLKLIVEALDRSWDVRIKEDERYQRAQHNLTIVPNLIADYITRAGGNAVRNWLRRGGPPYAEVLNDVCDVMDVDVPKGAGILATEERLVEVVMNRVWEAMTPKEREELERAARDLMEETGRKFDDASGSKSWLAPGAALALQTGLRFAGSALLRGAAIQVANVALQRGIAVALGPVGWAATGAWLVVDALGPSYRGLAPAVFRVAALRQKFLWAEGEEAEAI